MEDGRFETGRCDSEIRWKSRELFESRKRIAVQFRSTDAERGARDPLEGR